jgi:CheY-like chemotaxis protein
MSRAITVFLVDDDSDDTLLFEEVLKEVNSSIQMFSATNGQEAISMLSSLTVKPDIIFLDLNMPRID